jgi:hypothetical protein
LLRVHKRLQLRVLSLGLLLLALQQFLLLLWAVALVDHNAIPWEQVQAAAVLVIKMRTP